MVKSTRTVGLSDDLRRDSVYLLVSEKSTMRVEQGGRKSGVTGRESNPGTGFARQYMKAE
jgi:hypothetical protein